ncbi:MAG: c-type cytochrome [Balneolaceae bacterium]|nr:c-type cytochrome [Balneolaceae bacterium]
MFHTAMEADPGYGKTQLTQNCSICHSNGESGNSFGPNLVTIGDQIGKREILHAVVEPDAAVTFGYDSWMVTTKDGRALYGMLLFDGDVTVMSDLSGNRLMFTEEEIESKIRLTSSIMPDAYSLELSEPELADLISYLSEPN